MFHILQNTFKSHTAHMATFIVLRHPVITLVTALTNPDNLTNNHLILKLLITNGSLVDRKSTLREPSVNRKDEQALTLVGPTSENPVLDP